MQDSNMIGGSGGLTSFTDLADGDQIAEMRDPAAIMGNVQTSLGGYAALQALEGGYDNSDAPIKGKGGVVATKAGEHISS